MARRYVDLVKEITHTEGTGPLTLEGTPEGAWRAFAGAVPVGDSARVVIRSQGNSEWECTEATMLADGRLGRAAQPYSSSALGALVNLSPGPKEVFIALLAEDVLDLYALIQELRDQIGNGGNPNVLGPLVTEDGMALLTDAGDRLMVEG